MKLIYFILFTALISCQSNTKEMTYSKSWSQEEKNFLISSLTDSYQGVVEEVTSLDEAEWSWKAIDSVWSIAEVVEHLIVHDELFYREARVLTGLPTLPEQAESHFAADEEILSYKEITPQNTGKSPSYMEPMGRWCSKDEALAGYSHIRAMLIDFVKTTNKDLRQFYTSSGRGPTMYRDLHQLLLISGAHTERHRKQIQNIKTEMPKN
ncbi:MAG: DinB family protein [Bacteroidia bacterium]|nr:DinB family protein [Bacteroidia bacterium]